MEHFKQLCTCGKCSRKISQLSSIFSKQLSSKQCMYIHVGYIYTLITALMYPQLKQCYLSKCIADNVSRVMFLRTLHSISIRRTIMTGACFVLHFSLENLVKNCVGCRRALLILYNGEKLILYSYPNKLKQIVLFYQLINHLRLYQQRHLLHDQVDTSFYFPQEYDKNNNFSLPIDHI